MRVARKNRLQGVVELRQILDDRQTLESESVKPNLTEVTVDIPTAPRNKKMAVRISLAIGALLLISFSFYAYNRQASAPEPTPPVTVAPATPVTPATPTPKVAEPAATTPTTPERIAHAQTYTNSLGMEFVLIPAGTFMMGSPPDDKSVPSDEKPAHQVTISRPFYMGQYEVTQAQWEEVMGSNPSFFKGRNNPVEQVSWEDAQEFIKRLNQMEGTNKYRLPTEAEWEYAARAGTQTRYYFGDSEKNLGEYAWYDDNSNDETHPVGQKKPNAWGLYDMAGNVWEWVEDWYDSDYYSRSPGLDPPGPERGLSRVQRGGGWINFTTLCQSALRDDYNPGNRYLTLGFRLALSDSSVAKDEQAIVQPAADQGAVSSSLPQSPTNSLGMDFVLIPAGEFMMGSENGDRTEKPVHRVSISQAFYLGKYEVTQEEWEAVMGNNPSYFKGRKNPVEQVSYRLPTEAEWEYAARAGTTTDYSFGDDVGQLGNYAWFGDNSGKTTHPVGQKKPNPWGLYDMHGNVLE
ncbi:hypothetical protein FACS189460_5330 [Deltaproteobacteria bacterium]|nr:hypothetical protein FACS189460_5330 [Deltaproteobacteria bacterium]